MTFREWMDANRTIRQAKIAAMIGASQSRVSMIYNGKAVPSDAQALKIEEISRGEVSFKEAKLGKVDAA